MRINATEVKKELLAQFSNLANLGVRISHLDGHQHIHTFPVISRVISQALEELGVSKIRSCNVYPIVNKRMLMVWGLNFIFQKRFSKYTKPSLLIPGECLFSKRSFQSLYSIDTVAELMVHPRLERLNECYLRREEEFSILNSDKFYELTEGCKIINYNDL